MDILFVIGRIIFGGYFIFGGINHFRHLKMMSEYSKMKGVPLPGAAVSFSGLLLLIGGIAIFLGAYVRLGVLSLALFLIPVSFMMHNFWKIQDPQMKMGEMVNFMKNMALLGAALMLLAIPRPWPFRWFF
ncbi:MAG: DoxX family protein [Bacteroidota bacterium]